METLIVHTTFTDPAAPGVAIIWQMGTNKLALCRIGGPKGSYKIEEWHHHTYKTAEGALKGAERRFTTYKAVFGTAAKTPTEAIQKVVVQHT